MPRGNWDIWPNMYLLILGNSTSYKSTGLDSARLLLKQPSMLPHCKGADQMSTERLIQDLAEEPHRYYMWDEGATLFQMCNQSYNPTMKSFWTTVYRSRTYESRTKKETLVIENPYVTLAVTSTPNQIFDIKNKDADFLSGFLARFMIAPYFGSEQSIIDPPPHDRSKFSMLLRQLELLKDRPEREYRYSDGAKKVKDDWVQRLNSRHLNPSVEIAAFFKKMRDEHFHKLAILMAFQRDSHIIEVEDLKKIIPRLWETEKYWPVMLGEADRTHWDNVKDRIASIVREKHTISHSELLTRIRPTSGGWLKKLIGDLQIDEKVHLFEQGEGKKKRQMYEWRGD